MELSDYKKGKIIQEDIENVDVCIDEISAMIKTNNYAELVMDDVNETFTIPEFIDLGDERHIKDIYTLILEKLSMKKRRLVEEFKTI